VEILAIKTESPERSEPIPVGAPAFAFSFEGYGLASQPDRIFTP